MNTFLQDVRYGLRMLAKSPGFTAVAVLTLALGIGANTTIFSVVYGTMLRPLPYPAPDRLVQLAWQWQDQPGRGLTDNEFELVRQHARSFELAAAATGSGLNLLAGTNAAHVRGQYVSEDYFRLLGAVPALGRDFTPDEHQTGAPRAVILSDALWRTRFGADRNVLGQTILLNREPHTVVGVAPADFYTPSPIDLWMPLWPVKHSIGNGGNYTVLARLRPGVSTVQARDAVKVLIEEARRQAGSTKPLQEWVGVFPYQKALSIELQKPLSILFGAIGFVLLIACANVANLMLARAASRTREVAIRTALGASRMRLVRQLLTESLLLSLLGGALGLLVAVWGSDVLLSLAPADLLPVARIQLDVPVLGFTLLAAVLTGVVFGLAPAFQAARSDPAEWLKEGSGRSTSGILRGYLRNALAVGEVALSLILLAGAGLLIQTFAHLVRVDPGFDPGRVLSMQVWTSGSRYKNIDELAGFFHEAEAKMGALPGVEAVGTVAAGLPLERGGNSPIRVKSASEDRMYSVDFRSVTPDYFRALGVRLLQGRNFSDTDSANAPEVAIINDAFAREFFPAGSPVGQRFWAPDDPIEIVGVVSDVKSYPDQPAIPTYFIPLRQTPFRVAQLFEGWFPTTFLIRTAGDPSQIASAARTALKDVDTQVPVGRVRVMDQVFSTAVASPRFNMVLLGIFAGLGVLLAAIGVYGVISYSVAQQTHEIGIRMALGAQPAQVMKLVIARGLALTGIGILIGLGGAFWLTRFLAGMLFNVAPRDPLTFAAVAVLLALVALVACIIPARRAMRVDPLLALRYE